MDLKKVARVAKSKRRREKDNENVLATFGLPDLGTVQESDSLVRIRRVCQLDKVWLVHSIQEPPVRGLCVPHRVYVGLTGLCLALGSANGWQIARRSDENLERASKFRIFCFFRLNNPVTSVLVSEGL